MHLVANYEHSRSTSSVATKRVWCFYSSTKPSLTVPYSHLSQHVQFETMGDFGALAELQGRHVHSRRREGEVGFEADELPGTLRYLRLKRSQLQGAANSYGRIRYPAQK